MNLVLQHHWWMGEGTLLLYNMTTSLFIIDLVALTNQAQAEQAFANSSRYNRRFDATGYSAIRIVGSVTAQSGSANTPKLYPSYSADNLSYTNIGTTTGTQSISLSSTGNKATDWITLPGGAVGDVFFRITQSGGDGAADPNLQDVAIQLR